MPPIEGSMPPIEGSMPPGSSMPPIEGSMPPIEGSTLPSGSMPPIEGSMPPIEGSSPPPIEGSSPPPIDGSPPPPVEGPLPPLGFMAVIKGSPSCPPACPVCVFCRSNPGINSGWGIDGRSPPLTPLSICSQIQAGTINPPEEGWRKITRGPLPLISGMLGLVWVDP